MNYRKAKKSDLKQIIDLGNELFESERVNHDKDIIKNWGYTKQGKKYFKNCLKNDLVIVAENTETNEIIAMIIGEMLKADYYPFKVMEISNLIVKEIFRNNNIATNLMTTFKEYALIKGVDKFVLNAYVKNTNACEFYKKLGFSVDDVMFSNF